MSRIQNPRRRGNLSLPIDYDKLTLLFSRCSKDSDCCDRPWRISALILFTLSVSNGGWGLICLIYQVQTKLTVGECCSSSWKWKRTFEIRIGTERYWWTLFNWPSLGHALCVLGVGMGWDGESLGHNNLWYRRREDNSEVVLTSMYD